ncbi:hypothetical protein AB0G79_23320 [Streptomyces sp. NPDC020807]|uniref:hypothetical protein n=1 Tax=Streptomyces sp. NPDC020807 TaxID=3155119 RepID=UPI00340673F8
MYGPHQAPQTPPPTPATGTSGGQIALRVLFVALPLLSCGFLAGAPLLRLAVLTRRARDWWLFGAAVVASLALFVYLGITGNEKEEVSDLEGFLGVGAILALGAGSVTYYLVGEIRHFDRVRALHAHVPPSHAYGPGGIGVTVPSAGAATPNPYLSPPPHQSAPPPVPQSVPQPGAAAPRLDQVRAELDELSDLLRKDGREGGDGR